MNYYERHIGDYLKDTSHLSLLEHGVYTRLLDVYYTREGGIPKVEAARLVQARSKDERAALEVVLQEFFVLTGDLYVQDRSEREIARYKEKSEKAARSANARWSADKAHSKRNADAMRTHSDADANALPTQCEGNAPSNQTPVTKEKDKPQAAPSLSVLDLVSDGLEENTAAEFLTHRKRKRAVLTALAWRGFKSEVQKAGWTLPAAVEKTISRGWVSFEAGWVNGEAKGSRLTTPPPGTNYEGF